MSKRALDRWREPINHPKPRLVRGFFMDLIFMSTFLTPDEVRELTGIARGKAGKTREMLQAAALRAMKIPFYLNVVGRPIVTRHSIEGQAIQEDSAPTWEPAFSPG